jgi:hypothetical protein
MKESFEQLLASIPAYQQFFTLAEHDARSRDLAERFPDRVKLFEIGRSQKGRPILALGIGQGRRNALFYGCPHPNEPIGAMLIDHLAASLAMNPRLSQDLDYTFYLVKAWDVDSVVLNESWYKGPFDIGSYTLGYYRPPVNLQVDRTFPIDYKELHFAEPLPETAAMMRLIDEIKPAFVYSLHNAGFGGVFWYISDSFSSLFAPFKAAAAKRALPLDLGEPDAPYLETFAPAVFKSAAIRGRYDYLLKYGVAQPAAAIAAGNNDTAYARERSGSVPLATERPYL